jgi:hypothetical protein
MTLIVLGVVLTNLAMVSAWAWRTFASSQGFADVTTDMLKEPAVRAVVADQIVDALEEQEPTSRAAIAARPLVESIVAEIVGTPGFQGMFHAGVSDLHASVVNGLRSRLVVHVDDAPDLVRNGLAAVSPDLAAAIPDGAIPVAVGVSQSTPLDTAMRLASLAGWLAIPFVVGACACFTIAVHRARFRRRAAEVVGISLVLTGVAHFALLAVGVSLAASLGDDARHRTALRAVFWSVMHLINVQAKVVITIGAVLTVAAAHAGPGRIKRRLLVLSERSRRALARPGWRALACVALIAAGFFAMRWPEATAAIIVRGVAFVAFVAGAVGLLDVLGSVNWADDSAPRLQRAGHRLVLPAAGVVASVSAGMLFGGLAFVHALRAPTAAHADMAETGCNGHVELCDLRLDHVVFAGTHNSMAASSQHFVFARHRGGIDAQLASGVRAFLLDLHYGARVQHLVRTDFASESEEALSQSTLPLEQRLAVEGFLHMLGGVPADAKRTVYLCHLYCEFGATPANEAFHDIHDFLRMNPNEVVILDLEDFVEPDDAIKVLRDSGLADQAMTWKRGDPLPTLGEMIRRHKNVVVLAENTGGAAPWYIPAYDLMQDTPYQFDGPEDFSCDLGRGKAGNPMFLVNHWLKADPPDRSVAGKANEYHLLLARAKQCWDERGLKPNIIAVDFSDAGDLLDVVNELNGFPTGRSPTDGVARAGPS